MRPKCGFESDCKPIVVRSFFAGTSKTENGHGNQAPDIMVQSRKTLLNKNHEILTELWPNVVMKSCDVVGVQHYGCIAIFVKWFCCCNFISIRE